MSKNNPSSCISALFPRNKQIIIAFRGLMNDLPETGINRKGRFSRILKLPVVLKKIWTADRQLLALISKAYKEYESIPSIRGSNSYYDVSSGKYDDEYYEIKEGLENQRREAWERYVSLLRKL